MIILKLYFTLRRSTLFALFLIVICVIFVSSRFSSSTIYAISGDTNFNRISYLKSINCSVEEEIISQKDIVIPSEFSDVYKKYNEIQIKAGFNLLNFKGVNATIYTYKVTDYNGIKNAYANLIVSDGRIIGGDIFTTDLGGQMLPLLKTERKSDGKTKA